MSWTTLPAGCVSAYLASSSARTRDVFMGLARETTDLTRRSQLVSDARRCNRHLVRGLKDARRFAGDRA